MEKDLSHYLRLRYPMEIVQAEEGGYFAQIPDLPGCMAQGETIEEAAKNLEDAKRAWIEVRLEDGLEVPPPHEPVEEYSGRFLLRIPKSLHREVATLARREGTSLNQYALHLLSFALGRQRKADQAVDVTTESLSLYDYFARLLTHELALTTQPRRWEAFSKLPTNVSASGFLRRLLSPPEFPFSGGQEEPFDDWQRLREVTDANIVWSKEQR